jgi:hypothetical protein
MRNQLSQITIFTAILLFSTSVAAQCSSSNPCSIGCCSNLVDSAVMDRIFLSQPPVMLPVSQVGAALNYRNVILECIPALPKYGVCVSL